MTIKNFSIGKLFKDIKDNVPSFKFRDRDKTVHYASSAASCNRKETYKALGIPESNPIDNYGKFKLNFGNYIERGLNYELFNKLGLFGVKDFGGQGDAGEHGTFYGTSWHGYRDRDIAYKDENGNIKLVIVELKTKLGIGASMTVKESAFSKKFKVPEPDTAWGQAQQISLYLRDAYLKTKDNPKFPSPITDGILLVMFWDDRSKIGGFLEFRCKYNPDSDTCHFYEVYCDEYPQCCGKLDLTIDLKKIAEKWKLQDEYILKGELAPPEFERKYPVDDPRVTNAYKTHLQSAVKNEKLIGDMQCTYCTFKDKCTKDLGIEPEYSAAEIKHLKDLLKNR